MCRLAESHQNTRDARDREWIQRIHLGDESALGELFRAYHPELFHFASRYVRSEDIALDALQDVFATLWIQKKEIVIINTVASYLYGALRYRCLNIHRHERVIEQWRYTQPVENHVSPVGDAALLAEAIEYAVDQLPPRMREVFRLSRDSGLTHQEIADVLEISVNAVAVTMTRALKALNKALQGWL